VECCSLICVVIVLTYTDPCALSLQFNRPFVLDLSHGEAEAATLHLRLYSGDARFASLPHASTFLPSEKDLLGVCTVSLCDVLAADPASKVQFKLLHSDAGRHRRLRRWCECSCDVRLCSLRSAHANLVITMQLYTQQSMWLALLTVVARATSHTLSKNNNNPNNKLTIVMQLTHLQSIVALFAGCRRAFTVVAAADSAWLRRWRRWKSRSAAPPCRYCD
jgi:hypothetical protein